MKLFRFRGGVHPNANKELSSINMIETMPLPDYLYIPLQQHIGAPALPLVETGQYVLKGQLLAHSQGLISAPVHAPTSGTIVDIGDFTAPHPSGLPVKTITLEADHKDEWIDISDIQDSYLRLTPEEVSARVGAAGIVGMGGATFPSAVKLTRNPERPVHTLIINGGECEPYLTCDDRLMQERAKEITDGISIMLHALQTERALVAIEDNKPAALAAMQEACRLVSSIEVVKVPSLYPMGSEKQMIQTLTGMEVPAGKMAIDIGVLVHNVGTAHAVYKALRAGQPLVSRIVTVSGGAIRRPKNLEVPLGTLVSDVIADCGGFKEFPARLLMGGPMMGQVLPGADVPIVKGSSGIIALTEQEITPGDIMPCIRCGTCVTVCPCGLVPLEMAAHARKNDAEGAINFGLLDCISCGSCAYACPSNIPLVQYFNFAKGLLASKRETQSRSEKTRQLAELRTARLEEEARAKAEAAAKRKAEREKKKAQEAQAKVSA
jgi:electron transport complex protein RnfC